MSWQWMLKQCDLSNSVNGIKTILKADDDAKINTNDVINNLMNLGPMEFVCQVFSDSRITRDRKSPFYMSFVDFPWDREFYEPYCQGTWFLFRSDAVEPLNKISQLNMGFRHDDVYVGMLATCLPVKFTLRTKIVF
jgi:hypothetical protein